MNMFSRAWYPDNEFNPPPPKNNNNTPTKRCLIYLFPLKQINPCIYEDMKGSKAALQHLSLTHSLFLLSFLLGNFSLALYMCPAVMYVCVWESLSMVHISNL